MPNDLCTFSYNLTLSALKSVALNSHIPNDNRARACSDCLALTELTRLGEPKCLYGEKLARLGG